MIEKVYNHKECEHQIYEFWEKNGFFTPQIDKTKKPFCILLPPPNANAPLHMGHAMYVVEDIMCRYQRMKGKPTLFLPGTDHAGIETQYVFEKYLKERGKSRFDYDRETLYNMISEFVEKNRGITKEQMKKMGFSLDWTREKYTLQPDILKTIFETFRKLYKDGLIYREERIVNFCTNCGTSFSDLEIVYEEKQDYLYFLDYGIITIATTRPETIFADVAVAVNPKDKKYKDIIGKQAVIPLINKEIPIIADEAVEIEFGTGALKITPGHDATDFEIGLRHNLPRISCINSEGKMINVPKEIEGLSILEARSETVRLLEKEGKIIKIEPLTHSVATCYRCKSIIEPLLRPQWFVKVESLAKNAIQAVKKNKIKIFPPRFKKIYLDWMKNIKDWNISRQIVWGPRIPAWYCLECNPGIKINFIDKNKKIQSGYWQNLKEKYSFEEIKSGLQTILAPKEAVFTLEENGICPICKSRFLLQETDTFDTWFSSGQWPLTTLGYPDSEDFKYFYPTSVMDTMWDILFFWVARMIMFGLYLTKEVPFEVVHLHSRVVDIEHKKMSKSKGNVIDPIEMVDKYGADALRMALIFGTAPASDITMSEDKVVAMRNFANKIWNAGRFLLNIIDKYREASEFPRIEEVDFNSVKNNDNRWILRELEKTIKTVTQQIENYKFGQATETIYDFFWHKFCDKYIEIAKLKLKDKIDKETVITLFTVYKICLKLLNPFMPFVTEKIWSLLPGNKQPLIISSWPE